MCLGMNPDQLSRGRALRFDLEPELRRSPGAGWSHPPRLADRGGRDRRRRSLRAAVDARLSLAEGRLRGTRSSRRPGRLAARPRGRRHGPDHPERLAEAHRAHRIRRRACSRVATTTPTSCSNKKEYAGAIDPRRRSELRDRLVARARRLGARRLRLSRPSSVRASPTSSRTTRPAPGSSQSSSTRGRAKAPRGGVADSQIEITIDVDRRTIEAPADWPRSELRHR